MRIIIITTHSFPIPYKSHTGDIVILNLADTLSSLGHDVTLAAPTGTQPTNPNVKLLDMQPSFGKYPPSAYDCEREVFNNNIDTFMTTDIIHDFSVNKTVSHYLTTIGKINSCCTLMGGAWTHPYPPNNLVVWSEAHRNRVMRGATDYEGTPTPKLGGPNQYAVNNARVVAGGIDTDWYSPTYEKKDFFLWLNRWHPAKGYKQAIELAKKTGIKLVMSGEHPDNEMFEYQRNCALEAVELAKDASNISFNWLPPDPDHHTAKRELYRQAKALLYTVQFHEPFGLSQTEALSCGTPVIGINYGSVPEVISHNETGLVIDNDLDALADSIKNINNINPLKCREEAIKRFDIKIMAKSYEKEYQNILNGDSWN